MTQIIRQAHQICLSTPCNGFVTFNGCPGSNCLVLSTPCNGFGSSMQALRWVAGGLSTPCNGFTGSTGWCCLSASPTYFQLHVTDSRSCDPVRVHGMKCFQLHVTDSEQIREYKRAVDAFQLHVTDSSRWILEIKTLGFNLSTPCNGFLRLPAGG